MKLVFAGTPEFASTALEALIVAGHEIVLVLAQPDRPAGRGMQVRPGPVKTLALRHGIEVLQPRGLRLGGRHDGDARAAHARLCAFSPDAMVVAAYGLILPPSVLAVPLLGCINIHASLLPRWRGAAPVQRAIEAGDSETGITIMQMDAGLDTGPMLLVEKFPIDASDSAATLTHKLSILGGEAIVDALALLERGALSARPQHAADDASAVTYAAKLSKDEAALDFSLSARALVDRIRAFDPWPGCTALLVDAQSGAPTPYKVWRAETASARAIVALTGAAPSDAAPGRILGLIDGKAEAGQGARARHSGVVVATGDGAVALTELQKAGGRRAPAAAFARDFAGDRPLHFARLAERAAS